jgi:outer membrane protein OmpA-like peptidoglycan-associated protein
LELRSSNWIKTSDSGYFEKLANFSQFSHPAVKPLSAIRNNEISYSFNSEIRNAFERSFMKHILTILFLTIVAFLHCAGSFTKHRGLVEVGSIYGFVTNEALEPISSAQVMIAGDNESITFTNTAGYFILEDLIPGTYNIVVTKGDYEGKNFSADAGAGKSNEFNLVMKQMEMGKGKISGMVVDYISSEPLVVDVSITDLMLTAASDASGHFTFKDLEPKTYLMKFQALHYVTSHTDVMVLPDETVDIMMRMLKAGTVITLEGIEFEFGKAIIKPESSPVLDEAAAILTNHPEIEVEIQGHTDSIGTDQANLKLSQKRAEAVREYLIDVHMIEPVRMIPIGYGETKPIADNGTDQGRAKNRRVDFLILE